MRTEPRIAGPLGEAPAFTLLEIMIVIGMAALVMAISVPFVKSTIRRDAVYQAVHVIEDACLNARSAAIFNNATAELVIRPQDKDVSVRPGTALSPVVKRDPNDVSDDGPRLKSAGHLATPVKPFIGRLGDDVNIELLDVNFTEYRDQKEARVRFHPNGTSDELTIVMRIGGSAWRKVTLDLVTGLPTLEVMR